MMGVAIRERWSRRAGYRELLKLAFPLILSTGSVSILLFVDRMFLGWYSTESLAASVPAGVLNFALMACFFGTAIFTGTLVAQYHGAGRHERIGGAIGQGLYVALIGGSLMPMLAPFSSDIFAFIGHDPLVQIEESSYFRILNLGVFFALSNAVFAGFYSGRGKTWTVMRINVLMTLINIVLDYVLIFGAWGIPSYGIKGAAVATVVSHVSITILYLFLVTKREHDRSFRTRSLWRFDRPLFLRLLKFGLPSGIHFFLDVMGFTIFVLFVGRMGTLELTASNIVLQLNLIGFLPMVGMGISVSILVGQYQGGRTSHLAERTFYSAFQLTCIYNVLMISLYVLMPRLLIQPFLMGGLQDSDPALVDLSVELMGFIAVGIFFNTLSVLSGSALKGAGDTGYVMRVLAFSSVVVLVIPVYVVSEILDLPVYYAWGTFTVNLLFVSTVFLLRFRSGHWKAIEVIER